MAYNPLNRGKVSKAPSRSVSAGYQNGTLAGIVKSSAVSVDISGNVLLTDVSNELSVNRFVGLANELIPSATTGQVAVSGRIEDINIPAFAIGDAVYVGKTGLINTKPDIGAYGFVSGDWVIFVGVVVKNEFDLAKKDIQILIEIIGQL